MTDVPLRHYYAEWSRRSRYSLIARDSKGAPAMTDVPLRHYYAEWSRRMERPYHNPFCGG